MTMSEPLIGDQNDSYDDVREDPAEILDMPLCDVPRRKMLAVPPQLPVNDVINRMNEQSAGCALVVQDGALVGIFTERDVLQKVAAQSLDRSQITVREVMTPAPDTLPADASIAFALNRMSIEGYRHVPMLADDGAPIGVVSMRDIINWMVELYPSKVLNIPPSPSSFPRTPEGA